MLTLAALVVGTWAAGLAAMVWAQERLVFGAPRHRREAPAGPHRDQDMQPVSMPVRDGALLAGWLTMPSGNATGLVIWFGGRNEDVGWVAALASWLGPGWAVCSFNYRGCGRSTGVPGEAACVEDAAQIVAWASLRTGVPTGRVLLIGRSLGSSVALQTAARLPVAGLVLLAPPASLRRLVLRKPVLAPAAPWLRHPFDSLAAAPAVRCASLILLAERDGQVPHSESHRLARALHGSAPDFAGRRCQMLTIKGTDHRSLPRCARSLAAMARFAHTLQVEAGHDSQGPATPARRSAS